MRVLAIDYGDARTGIAISDAMGLIVGQTTVIHSRRPEKTVAEMKFKQRLAIRFLRDDIKGDVVAAKAEGKSAAGSQLLLRLIFTPLASPPYIDLSGCIKRLVG